VSFTEEAKAQHRKTHAKSLTEMWRTPIVSSPGVLDSCPHMSLNKCFHFIYLQVSDYLTCSSQFTELG